MRGVERKTFAVSKIAPTESVADKSNNENILDEITAHIKKINEEKKTKLKPISKNHTFKDYLRLDVVSIKSQIGFLLIILGIILTFLAVILTYLNIMITTILAIFGFILFYLGIRIITNRFVKWWRKRYKVKKGNYDN
jgi:uncharacterized membrane protein